MELQGVTLLLLVSMFQLIGAHYYENYILSGDGTKPLTFKNSLDDCVATCGDDCVAVSYSYRYAYCIITTCGNMELQKVPESGNWYTLVFGNPVIEGETVPRASHEWGLTETCGLSSVGTHRTPSFIATGTDFQNVLSPIFGKALHFPNSQSTTGVYAYTLPDPSISAYMPQDVSFSVAFYVYFNVLPPNAELFEFMTQPGSYAWHFWLWPDTNTPFANLLTANGTNQGVSWTRKFQASVWNHMAYSYDASAGTLSLYINGTYVGYQLASVAPKSKFDRVYLGGRPYANMGFYNGSIFCVSTYNHTLSNEEVVELQRSCVDGKIRFRG